MRGWLERQAARPWSEQLLPAALAVALELGQLTRAEQRPRPRREIRIGSA